MYSEGARAALSKFPGLAPCWLSLENNGPSMEA